MARDPRKGGSRSKTPSKKGLPRRNPASRGAPKRARKSSAKVRAKLAKPARVNRGGAATLKRELKEAQARQAATAEILKIIARSPTDPKPVFDAIVRAIVQVVQCDRAFIMRCDEKSYQSVAMAALDGSFVKLDRSVPIDPAANFPSRAIVSKKTVYHPDWSRIDLPEYERRIQNSYGMSCSLYLPLLRQGKCIGLLALASKGTNAFSPSDIALAESFRDQALIAIENARLFNETKEALARQTATADVLKVIASSPSNLQPVFDAIAERSKALIGAHATTVTRYVDGMFELAAFTSVSPEADAVLRRSYPRRPIRGGPAEQIILRGEVAQIVDIEVGPQDPSMRANARARGWRSVLQVPLKDETEVIGWISITRKEAGPFAEKDVELLRTFADQAVIAIQNVELFEEVQARTRDLQESLQQQTATADVLQVISRSAFDLDTVMNTLARSALELCGSKTAALFLREGDILVSRGRAADEPIDEELIKIPVP